MKIFTYVFGIWEGYNGSLKVDQPFKNTDEKVPKTFLSNDTLNQHILLLDGKKGSNNKKYLSVKRRVKKEKDLYPAFHYDIKNVRCLINPKNMNIALINSLPKDKNDDEALVYIVISDAYKVCSFDVDSEVLSVFHGKNYQGLLMKITKSEMIEYLTGKPFFQFTGKKVKINRFVTNKLFFTKIPTKNNRLQIQSTSTHKYFSGEKLTELRAILTKYPSGLYLKPSMSRFYTTAIIYPKLNSYDKIIPKIQKDYMDRGMDKPVFYPVTNMDNLTKAVKEIAASGYRAMTCMDINDVYRFNYKKFKDVTKENKIIKVYGFSSLSRRINLM